MEWVYVIANIVCFLIFGLIIRHYLPTYMQEKGKNLATKEDIADITRKTEEVQNEFREGFEKYTSNLRFKYDYYYKQYAELYAILYSIICQSEYTRRFLKVGKGQIVSFDEAPFLEITPTKRVNVKTKFGDGKPAEVSRTEEIIETDLSRFNKKFLTDMIIENGSLATQQLLKLAISYRFAYQHYSGNPEVKNSEMQDTGNEEEFLLIRRIVCCVVSEYNSFRKELKMSYSEEELTTGIPSIDI